MSSAALLAQTRAKLICGLGLGAEAAVLLLQAELRTLVGALGCSFFLADDHGALRNIFDDNPELPKIVPIYLEHFYNSPHDISYTFESSLRNQIGVMGLEDLLTVDVGTFRAGAAFNEVVKPLGYHDFIRLIIRDNGRGVGCVMLFRGPGEAAFSAVERAALASMEPFLAHAIASRPDPEVPLSDSGQSGLLVADRHGRCVFASSEGRRLLFLAQNPTMSPDTPVKLAANLPPQLVTLCRRLAALFSGQPVDYPPVFHHRNVWGGFSFRAHWLDDEHGSGLVGITITHQEPPPARMARTLSRLPLTRRQMEVGLMLATGASNAEAAERLGISKHTVVSHERWLYHKLDVRSRLELVRYLLGN